MMKPIFSWAAAQLLPSVLAGFFLSVLFYLCGGISAQLPGIAGWLVDLAHLPGAPFERFFPWLPAVCIVFAGKRNDARSEAA